MGRKEKINLEFLLVRAELSRGAQKKFAKSSNIGQIDLVWPRTSVARKSGAREMSFKRGVCDFSNEQWAKRIVFREEIEGHCGIAVSITESVTKQKIKRFMRLTAKYALKMGADFMEKAMVGYADIASSPMDALAMMLGEKDVPSIIARGVYDFSDLPAPGEERVVEIELEKPSTLKSVGKLTLLVKG